LQIGYLAADRSREGYLETAQNVGVDMARVKLVSVVSDRSLDLNLWERDPRSFFMGLLNTHFSESDLIIVDPIGTMLGVDFNKYHLVAPRLVRLNRWCEDTGRTLILTHHTSKLKFVVPMVVPPRRKSLPLLRGRVEDRAAGSVSLTGFTASHLTLQLPEEVGRPFHALRINRRNAPPLELELARNGAAGFIIVPSIWQQAYKHFDEAGLAIVRALPLDGSPVPRVVVAEQARLGSATLSRKLEEMKAAGLVGGADGKWWAVISLDRYTENR